MVAEDDIVLVVAEPGPPGPPGSGGSGTGNFTHNQAVANATWLIVHNLGFRPNVYATDGTNEVEGEVVHISANALNLKFDSAVSGTAYLS